MLSVPTILARGLTKSYHGIPGVAAVDLELESGSVLGLLGPNGAGKTTLIRILSTMLTPDAGEFTVVGIPGDRPAEIRQHIGVLPESAGYPRAQTGLEWLTYHARLFGQSRRQARASAHRVLDEVGLTDRGDTLISGYSRGMRQRLGIARALINDPEVVFLDEPTSGLDPIGQSQVLAIIAGIARRFGVTVLLSTHVLGDVEDVCDQVIILNRGRIVAQGTVAEVVLRASAPRQATVLVPVELWDRALMAFAAGGEGIDASRGPHRPGEIQLSLPADLPAGSASTRALGLLLAADVPVLGFALDGGRLSDAFLAVTGDRAHPVNEAMS